jgi:hypothetical protein
LLGQISQLLLGVLDLAREVVEVGQGAVVAGNLGAEGLDEGGIGSEGQVVAEIEARADGLQASLALFGFLQN